MTHGDFDLVPSYQVYPTPVRGRGLGLSASIARFTSVISPFLGAVLLRHSPQAPLALYAASFLFAAITAAALPLETRGKVLQDTMDTPVVSVGENDQVANMRGSSGFTRIPT